MNLNNEVITEKNTVAWRAPSNIALVKYWGKSGIQIPMNPSISLTLSKCYSETSIKWVMNEDQKEINFNFFINGESDSKFNAKILKFFERISQIDERIKKISFSINSKNTFPHSTGIASSASGFAALALCIVNILFNLDGKKVSIINPNDEFLIQSSLMARLGSGSACRSIYPLFSLWGKFDYLDNSNNEYAIALKSIHPNIENLKDAIIIVDDKPKDVSSTVGHSLMNEHVFRDIRIEETNKNINLALESIKSGDFNALGNIIEKEALMLHALMMTSQPPYILIKANSLLIIEEVKKFRAESNIDLFFTLDAGPNIHLIYQKENETIVESFINKELKNFYIKAIIDEAGLGPQKIY